MLAGTRSANGKRKMAFVLGAALKERRRLLTAKTRENSNYAAEAKQS